MITCWNIPSTAARRSGRDKAVPPVLLSGHHANVEKWRREESIKRTLERRPDLLEDANLTEKEKKFLTSLKKRVRRE